MRRTLNIVLALILANAWAWTGWLKDNGLVNETFRLWALVVITVAFVIQQVVLNMPKPAHRSAVEKRREVIEIKLSVLVSHYYKQLKNASVTPAIRGNLSFPTRVFPYRWRLKIYYFYTSDGSALSNDERELKFKKGEGAIGRAWAEQDMIVYDRVNERFKSSFKSVHKKKIPLLSHIQSILAVPILDKDKTIGVLCLDSEFPITETKFDQREIAVLARSHANDLAGLCFFDGVK